MAYDNRKRYGAFGVLSWLLYAPGHIHADVLAPGKISIPSVYDAGLAIGTPTHQMVQRLWWLDKWGYIRNLQFSRGKYRRVGASFDLVFPPTFEVVSPPTEEELAAQAQELKMGYKERLSGFEEDDQWLLVHASPL